MCSLWIVRWVGESRLQSDTIIVDISKVFRYGGSRAKLTGAWDEEGDFPKNEGCWHIATTKKIFYCTTATTSTTAAVDECTIILYTSADIATPHTVSVLCNTRKPTHPHTYAHTRILVDACVFDVWVTRQPWNHNHVRTHDVPRREQAGIPYPHCHHYPSPHNDNRPFLYAYTVPPFPVFSFVSFSGKEKTLWCVFCSPFVHP